MESDFTVVHFAINSPFDLKPRWKIPFDTKESIYFPKKGSGNVTNRVEFDASGL